MVGRVAETYYSVNGEVKADAALLELVAVEAAELACSDSEILLLQAAKMMKILPSSVEGTREFLPPSSIHQPWLLEKISIRPKNI